MCRATKSCTLLPNIQGQGPIASAMRIAMKLRHQSWVPSFITDYFGKEFGGGRKKDEEMYGRAVKVLDLLQHAAELGHTDALYTLAKISLVSTLHVARQRESHAGVVPTELAFPF